MKRIRKVTRTIYLYAYDESLCLTFAELERMARKTGYVPGYYESEEVTDAVEAARIEVKFPRATRGWRRQRPG